MNAVLGRQFSQGAFARQSIQCDLCLKLCRKFPSLLGHTCLLGAVYIHLIVWSRNRSPLYWESFGKFNYDFFIIMRPLHCKSAAVHDKAAAAVLCPCGMMCASSCRLVAATTESSCALCRLHQNSAPVMLDTVISTKPMLGSLLALGLAVFGQNFSLSGWVVSMCMLFLCLC